MWDCASVYRKLLVLFGNLSIMIELIVVICKITQRVFAKAHLFIVFVAKYVGSFRCQRSWVK